MPVIPLKGLSEMQKRQLMLADNRIALNAGWDAEMLNLELRELSVLSADLKALGFTEKELSSALCPISDGLTDENEIPEVAETAITSPGDVWCLGSHRLIYEPFLGSGTTLIAAETSGRVCFAIELDPLYVDVAVRRWQAFTGRKTTLLSDHRDFDAVAAERNNETTQSNGSHSPSDARDQQHTSPADEAGA